MFDIPKMHLQQKSVQTLKQTQCLMMSSQMQQAILLLQTPIMELSSLIDLEMQQNPVLEYSEERTIEETENEDSLEFGEIAEKELDFESSDFSILHQLDEDFQAHFSQNEEGQKRDSLEQRKLQTFLESSVVDSPTLFHHLMAQAHEVFFSEKEIQMAELIIGNLDRCGFLMVPLEEISLLGNCNLDLLSEVLKTVQTFTPAGVGALNIKESLLIQLRLHGKEHTLSYLIISLHFEDLIHNRLSKIKKSLKCSLEEIEQVTKQIAFLDFYPGTQFSTKDISLAFADAMLIKEEGLSLKVIVNEDSIPRLCINNKYLQMLRDEKTDSETKDFVKQKIDSAKWFFRNILERNQTLYRITESLAKRHEDFFLNPSGKLIPLTMKAVAEELMLHESTIVRAVSNKYIETPRGLLPLRFFFTSGLSSSVGEDVSANTVKNLIKEFIKSENPCKPLSDAALSKLINAKGIQIARRTVTKYRTSLDIGTLKQRRKYKS